MVMRNRSVWKASQYSRIPQGRTVLCRCLVHGLHAIINIISNQSVTGVPCAHRE